MLPNDIIIFSKTLTNINQKSFKIYIIITFRHFWTKCKLFENFQFSNRKN